MVYRVLTDPQSAADGLVKARSKTGHFMFSVAIALY